MYYIGMFLLVWLSVGFVIGIKHIFVDGTYEEMKEEMENVKKDRQDIKDIIEIVFKSKINYLIYVTLTGLFALYVELGVLWIDVKYSFKRLKIRLKRQFKK